MDSRWKAYAYLGPALVLFALFTAYPVFRSVQMSFQDYEFLKPDQAEYIGLGNYREGLIEDDKAHLALGNTLFYTAMFLPLYVLLPLPIAFLIDRLRRQAFMRVVTFLPVVVSGAVIAVLWTTLYHPTYGPFTTIWKAVFDPERWARLIDLVGRLFGPGAGAGLSGWLAEVQNLSFLGSAGSAMPSLVVMAVWHGFGFNVLLYLVRLAAIPDELYEAAAVDGASRWHTFWSVTVPLLRPAIYLVMVLGLIGSLKVFGPMFIMTRGGPKNSTLSLVMYIYQTAFQFGNLRFGYAAAMAVMLAIIIMTFAILSSRLNRPVDE